MAFCPHCGTQSPDNYTQCPNCGASLPQMQTPPPQPVYQGPPQNPYAGGYAQPVSPMDEITSTGSWFGWYLLVSILPVIGPIIMLSATKDPSAKNFAKLWLILQAVVVVIYILFFFLAVVS